MLLLKPCIFLLPYIACVFCVYMCGLLLIKTNNNTPFIVRPLTLCVVKLLTLSVPTLHYALVYIYARVSFRNMPSEKKNGLYKKIKYCQL